MIKERRNNSKKNRQPRYMCCARVQQDAFVCSWLMEVMLLFFIVVLLAIFFLFLFFSLAYFYVFAMNINNPRAHVCTFQLLSVP